MICSNCKTANTNEAAFCENCGKTLKRKRNILATICLFLSILTTIAVIIVSLMRINIYDCQITMIVMIILVSIVLILSIFALISKNGKQYLALIGLSISFGILSISFVFIANNNERLKKVEYHSRPIEEIAFAKIGSNFVYWTTQGTNTNIHLYSDCNEFKGKNICSGSVNYAVAYFYYNRNVYFDEILVCPKCENRAKYKANGLVEVEYEENLEAEENLEDDSEYDAQ